MKSFYSADYRLKKMFRSAQHDRKRAVSSFGPFGIYSTSQAQVIVDELTRGRVDKGIEQGVPCLVDLLTEALPTNKLSTLTN